MREAMAQCSICSSEQARSINRLLLTHGQITVVAKQFGFDRAVVGNHLRKHLPWRSRRAKKPETVMEELEVMEFELRRLMVLAECGESIGGAIQALTARRALAELRLRLEGKLDATHKKLMLASQPVEGEYDVVFEGGRPRTVKKAS
jgi:hypothetical protein